MSDDKYGDYKIIKEFKVVHDGTGGQTTTYKVGEIVIFLHKKALYYVNEGYIEAV